MWHMYTIGHTSAIKRKETGSSVQIWMDLGIVILSEESQTGKDKYDNTYIWNLKKGYKKFKKGTGELICKITELQM